MSTPGVNDPNRRYAGFATLVGGVDSSKSPSLLGQEYCAEAINVTLRNGFPRSRPGYGRLNLTFPDADQEAYFRSQLFQGAAYYQGAYADEILAMIGGRLFRIRIRPGSRDASVSDITPGQRNSRRRPFAYFCQVGRYMVIQDGESAAIIYDGGVTRRAAKDEVPVGSCMAFGYGRLAVALPGGREFVLGDIDEGGDEVLKFTENIYLAEGGAFSVPASMGPIKCMTFLPVQDTATGQGELLVFCEFGVTSVFVSVPRVSWKETQIQRVALINQGALGHRAVVVINGDCWFRSQDGWRSYRQARAEIGGWNRTAMSNEIGNYLAEDTLPLMGYVSAIYFDNRLLFTFGPQRFNLRNRHAGIASLDFQVLTSFGRATAPAWEGVWTGLQPTQLLRISVAGVERAIAFAWDYENGNTINEISRRDPDDDGVPIVSSLTLRSYDFEAPFTEKELYGGELWITDLSGTATISVDFRSDQANCWQAWHDIEECQTVEVCTNPDGSCALANLRPGARPRITIPKPSHPSSGTGRPPHIGFEFQPRIRWSGDFRLHKARFSARLLTEPGRAHC